jgi:hypothetical protein
MLLGSFSPRRLGWRSPRSFLRESYSGLRDGIDGCLRSHSSCYRWRTHRFKACFHKARSHQCPHQEDRREQAYDGEETSVAWTLAAASGRLFISVHDPHSIKIFEGQHFRSFQVPTAIHSCIDTCQYHLKSHKLPGVLVLHEDCQRCPDERTSRDAAAKSDSCHQQRKSSLKSITSSARATNVAIPSALAV